MRASLLAALAVLTATTGGCKSVPATVLLHVRAEAGLPFPDELRLSVLGPAGVELRDQRLPAEGKPVLPGDTVLYPHDPAAPLRIDLRALVATALVGEGAASVQPRPGAQVEAIVTLQSGLLPDGDGDGVPDAIDSCPAIANPQQGPCGGPDASADAAQDARPDQRADLRPDMRVSCTTDAECDDKNPCTADACVAGQCQRTPTKEGQACDDGNACTTGTACKSGVCAGGSAVSCPAPPNPCSPYVCDPVAGCQVKVQPDGTGCSDGLFCTDPDTCSSGKCVGKPRDCAAGAATCVVSQGCSEAQGKCLYTQAPNGAACSDNNPCTQGETCSGGTCMAPPLTTELISQQYITRGTDLSTKLDAAGKVHMAYHLPGPPSYLIHVTNASGSWTEETIETHASSSVGGWPSLGIDSKGTIYIAYYSDAQGSVKLAAHSSSSGWQTNSIDAADGYAALVVEPSGKLHAVYRRSGDLQYASGTFNPPGSPNLQKTKAAQSGTYPSIGLRSSIALDAGGKVHVAHGAGSTAMDGEQYEVVQELLYSTNKSGQWVTIAPASSVLGARGAVPSIAVASTGEVFIAHSTTSHWTDTTATLYLTSQTSNGWKTDPLAIAGQPEPGTASSLLVGANLHLYLAFRNPTTGLLRFATNASGSWNLTSIEDTGAGTNAFPSLVRAASGALHVTYKTNPASGSEVHHAVFSACP
jgi:hypothetical protein